MILVLGIFEIWSWALGLRSGVQLKKEAWKSLLKL